MKSPILIEPKQFYDERGFFYESYNSKRFLEFGIDCEFVQDNQSYSKAAGTIRGLHFQAPPFAQAKLVRVVRGRILDVVVDIRRTSPTYGRHLNTEISSENGWQLFVPIGYAHGFITLEPDTEVAYKVNNFYDKTSEGGLRWDDPAIGISWGMPRDKVVLSAKDQVLPELAKISQSICL